MECNQRPSSSAGGGAEVPIEVDTLRFATARIQEIASITQTLDEEKKNTLLFQRLPRHMRRRAMSHNPKRMPRNQREAFKQQLLKSSKGSIVQQKKPSRKYRRRPVSLLDEYNRRQRSHVWLETHIWHAKRFHMTERWGYRLAHFPNDRSYRACYRAAANHCLMQDVSFLGCIELQGPLNVLLDGLSKHTSSCVGLTFGAQSLLDGSREGDTMFYECNQYPWQSIGSVSFFWKPNTLSTSSDIRSIWIWAHPAFYQHVVDALLATFQLGPVSNMKSEGCEDLGDVDKCTPKKKRKLQNGEAKNVEEVKLETRNVPFERTPKYRSSVGSVEMFLLKDTLNRFRLTGPLSQEVLKEALQLANNNADDQGGESHISFWLENQKVSSPAELPPRMILCLTVKDPRLNIPDKRTKALPDRAEMKTSTICHLPPAPYSSPLWSASTRDDVTKGKLSSAEINALRSKFLVSGVLKLNEDVDACVEATAGSSLETSVNSKIPLLLVQRPGSQDPLTKRLGFGCGWDIIFPAGWAMPFWLAFNFRCARAAGLREASSHELERGLCEFLSPDTTAGMEEESRKGEELRDTHFRLPPDKRPNFIKLGVVCPFQCDWSNLIRDWALLPQELNGLLNNQELSKVNENAISYFVLRDASILSELNRTISDTLSTLQNKMSGQSNQKPSEAMVFNLPSFPNQEYSLLPVRVEALQKGLTDNMSLICIPSSDDVVNLVTSSLENVPVEPLHTDKNHEQRLNLRKEHKKLLLRLRKQRVRAKKKQEEENVESRNVKRNDVSVSPTKDLVVSHNKKMEELWLLDSSIPGSVRNSATRETAGFVTRGDFSFTEARGCGVGYISFLSLQKLLQVWLKHFPSGPSSCLKRWGLFVLVRSPNSFQYRLAKLSLILNRK